jgi:hypothetical protein
MAAAAVAAMEEAAAATVAAEGHSNAECVWPSERHFPCTHLAHVNHPGRDRRAREDRRGGQGRIGGEGKGGWEGRALGRGPCQRPCSAPAAERDCTKAVRALRREYTTSELPIFVRAHGEQHKRKLMASGATALEVGPQESALLLGGGIALDARLQVRYKAFDMDPYRVPSPPILPYPPLLSSLALPSYPPWPAYPSRDGLHGQGECRESGARMAIHTLHSSGPLPPPSPLLPPPSPLPLPPPSPLLRPLPSLLLICSLLAPIPILQSGDLPPHLPRRPQDLSAPRLPPPRHTRPGMSPLPSPHVTIT